MISANDVNHLAGSYPLEMHTVAVQPTHEVQSKHSRYFETPQMLDGALA